MREYLEPRPIMGRGSFARISKVVCTEVLTELARVHISVYMTRNATEESQRDFEVLIE